MKIKTKRALAEADGTTTRDRLNARADEATATSSRGARASVPTEWANGEISRAVRSPPTVGTQREFLDFHPSTPRRRRLLDVLQIIIKIILDSMRR